MKTERDIMNDFAATLPNKQRFTISEAAVHLGMSIRTIQRWIESGVLKVLKVGPNSRKIPRQSLLDVVKEYDPYE